MKRVYHHIIKQAFLLLFLLGGVLVHAQSSKVKQADKAFDKASYIEAAAIYEAVANKGYRSISLLQKLGDSYYFNGKYNEAVKWYRELYGMSQDQPNAYNLRYAQSLKSTGDIALGEKYYDRYLASTDTGGKDYVSASRYLAMIEQNSGRYTMEKLSINSKGIDFGTGYKGDSTIVFASSRTKSSLISKWDGEPYLDLYEVAIKGDSLGEPKKLKGSINGKYHESTAVFTKDGQTMYFTRNEVKADKEDGLYRLDVYRATQKDGKWTDEEFLDINGVGFNTAHPALNAAGDKLYFASDRPGGEGGTDLYYVTIGANGTLGTPVNLGKKINTPGRESFPFINAKDELYFSSDGHFGLGGYDVFYVKLKGDAIEGSLLNVGKPINSQYDDVCYVTKAQKGFVSSNRSDGGGEGFDNIYSFVELEPIKQLSLYSKLYGVVSDKTSGMPLAGASVVVLDTDNKPVASLTTDGAGYYETEVGYAPAYLVKASKDYYGSADAFSKKEQEDREHNFELATAKAIGVGTDLADVLEIPMIYFDLNKWNIRPDAELELQKVIELLKVRPSLKIDIRSHTDSRANDAYNMTLSNKRAKSTMEYLIAKGIDRSRLTARGFGETQLVNYCGNGIECTESEHQQNRRSEFIVVSK